RGDEAAHASARLPIRELRRLPRRTAEPALATGRGEDRRRSRRIEAGRGWPRQLCLPDYCLDVHTTVTTVPARSAAVHRRVSIERSRVLSPPEVEREYSGQVVLATGPAATYRIAPLKGACSASSPRFSPRCRRPSPSPVGTVHHRLI